MHNKYCLTQGENLFLAKKRWAESIYCGMRMENRNVTFPQTQTILDGINVAGVALDDIQAILNMRDAWKYLLAHIGDTLDIDYLCALQERVAYREALSWGELRGGSVGISGVKYIPPVPDATVVGQELSQLAAAQLSTTEIALNTFAWIARSQLFWDGNKRTALLAANKILIEGGAGILLVPDEAMVAFSTLLSDYYETGYATQLRLFLYESCIFGIDASLPGGAKPMPSPDEDRVVILENKRTAVWLKHARRTQNITQKALAQAIGVSTSAIANIEQEQRKGSNEVWARIEQYFDKTCV